jgi:hypothetical protein
MSWGHGMVRPPTLPGSSRLAFTCSQRRAKPARGQAGSACAPRPRLGARRALGRLVQPRTPVEEALARIWAEVLGVERIGVTDAFLDLGGNSLLAGLLAASVQRRFGVSVRCPLSSRPRR